MKNENLCFNNSRIECVKIIFKDYKKCVYKAINGTLNDIKEIKNGYEITIKDEGMRGRNQCLIKVSYSSGGFTFFPFCVSEKSPVYYREENVVITKACDQRSYEQIASEIENSILNGKTQTETNRLEKQKQTQPSDVKKLDWHRCPTFMAIDGNVNIWEAGFRGFPIEEKQHFDLYDYFIPRQNWDRRDFGDDAKRIVYRYFFGRGMGANSSVKRENYKGFYPSLIAKLSDGGIDYKMQAFCDETGIVGSDIGTDYLNAMYHSAAVALSEEEIALAKQSESNITVLRAKITAENNQNSGAIAYFRLPTINTNVMAETKSAEQKIENGLGYYKNDVYMLVSVDGVRQDGEEFSFVLNPGESVTIKLLLFHKPVKTGFAKTQNENDFELRLKQREKLWNKTMGDLKKWSFPEKTIEKAFKTGCFHLFESCYGKKESEHFAPCVGVYAPIGSESSPVMQFFDSVGLSDLAGKCLNMFFDREQKNGLIQNMKGYMLENGATLYNEWLHFCYTKDYEQLKRNIEKIQKAAEYIIKWIERNKDEKPYGFGMIDGQVADPEDTFRSFSLNSFAYAGLNGAAKLYKAAGLDDLRVKTYAAELKNNVIKAFRENLKRAPLVPLKDGSWVPLVAPWAENRGACSLHLNGEICFSHASHVLKDSLLSTAFLVYYGIFDKNSPEANIIVNIMADLYSYNNTGFSQPYYSLLPLINLARGEKNAFLAEYYTAFMTIADRETYSFWEHYFLATPHKTHEQAWFLMRTRFMLYREENEKLLLLTGIPDSWRKIGKKIVIKNARSLYGKFSLKVSFSADKTEYEFESENEKISAYMSINGHLVEIKRGAGYIDN